ncbi:DOD [Symbiodinium natans]|uniref:DOD protein n=1 Tax=Symbiodinium natans TaxID=878477 RepID=A0A812HPR5_9DINO|nr:DOD [Symbiodinium natans]
MSERPLKRSAGTRGHRSAPVILAAGECLLDGDHLHHAEHCPMSPRASPTSVSSQNVSPREQILVQAMDRLAGIDIRRTFDLDGSGFVSAAVLRRSLSAFDPQVFNAQCLQVLLGPAQSESATQLQKETSWFGCMEESRTSPD